MSVAHLAPSGPMPARAAWTSAARDRMPSVTVVATAAPIAATPAEPPRVRKKVTPEVAAPMACGSVVFCTTSTRFCIVMPMPRPTSAM